jgi:hypothetical protein
MLITTTILINFGFLIAAVWLGIYVITRNPRSLVSWLTGLTLWSVAGLFLNMLLALNPPPLGQEYPIWMSVLLPFWTADIIKQTSSSWLQGWLVAPAIVFWHHVTILLRQGGMNPWRWTRVLLGYLVALATILLLVYSNLIFARDAGDPIYMNTLNPGPLYPLFMLLLILFTIFCLINLVRSTRAAPSVMQRNQLRILIFATLIAGLVGPVEVFTELFSIGAPRVTLSILLGIAVILIGYGVAQYSALVQGRTIRRDFIYNAIAMLVISGLYILVTRISAQFFDVPPAVYIFIVLLAIVTHSLIDFARQFLDYLFFNRERRNIRHNLTLLADSVGERSVSENLDLMFASMCTSVRATFGMIILFDEYQLNLKSTYKWRGTRLPLSRGDLSTDDVRHLEPGHFPNPLSDVVLLIPLYDNPDQAGAILFGTPINGVRYSNADVEQLLYPSDQILDAIRAAEQEEEYLEKLPEITQAQKTLVEEFTQEITIKMVEDALRNLFDYAYLGDSQLVKLRLVTRELPGGATTYIDKGKAVNKIFTSAVEKLRPGEELPAEPLPREWHAYTILNGAYIEDRLNRDIMSQLYISEGTFNRTRRAAIRSVRRMLEEMEAALN